MDKAVAAEALPWLSREDHAAKHDQVKSERLPRTLDWFTNSAQFRRWLTDKQQVMLCLGRPGTGKTTLTSMVVDVLFERYGTDPDIGIAFLYPSFENSDRKPEQLLRSMLLQLGQRLPSVPSALVDLHNASNNDASPPSVQDLFNVMSEIMSNMSKVYLVIDALDELSSSDRRKLLPGLLRLRETLRVSLFATSRPLPDVIQRFKGFSTLDIDVTTAAHDLHAYITQRMATLPNFVRNDRVLRQKTLQRVKIASGGLIITAKTLMDLLAAQRDISSFRPMLPQKQVLVHDIYAKMMKNIELKPKEEKGLTKIVLSWLLFAQRPLVEAELQHALRIEVGSLELVKDDMPDVTEIVASCEGFVTAPTMQANTWSLVHSTAAAYLRDSVHHWNPKAEEAVASGCMTYLASDAFYGGWCKTDEEFESRMRDNPLYRYAAQHWPEHLRSIEILPEKVVCSFLLDQNKVSSASQAMKLSETESRQPGYSQDFDHQQTGLHLAAHFGLERAVDLLLTGGQHRALKDSQGRTPLWRATEGCHSGIMRKISCVDRASFTLMLNKKEDSLAWSLLRVAGQTTRDRQLRTALHIGVVRGNLDLIQDALECGIEINARDADGCSAIQLAIRSHNTSAIDILLHNSASTEGITAPSWLEAYGRPSSDILELSEDVSGRKQVAFFTTGDLTRDDLPASHVKKYLYVVPDISAWPVDDSMDPSYSQADKPLCSKYSSVSLASTDEYIICYSVIASIPVQAKPSDGQTFSHRLEPIRIAWSMITLPDSSGRDRWIAVNYLSTLPIGSIPDSGATFFKILVTALMESWLQLCSCIDRHLIMCRPNILEANGEQPMLIDCLLKDANIWCYLRHLLHAQVEAIRDHQEQYRQLVDGDEVTKSLASTTENFAQDIGMRIDKFDTLSAALIQLEFNLTSIREAQKSTSLNRSMKRLSWITFIFLPLVFVSGLFGMNVDILESNPSWRWCAAFMVGTLGLTMVVWIICKRFPDWEDRVERSFNLLLRSPKHEHKLKDLERGSASDKTKKNV